jgi:PAS domain S-box-containing protein
VSAPGVPPEQSAEELFEEAPCGYLTTTPDGTILQVNRTLERWLGVGRDDLVGRRRFVDLLSPGSRIYHETHYAPLLRLQGEASEIALELTRDGGTPLPVLVNSMLVGEGDGAAIRATVFDATERRRYERELLAARREEHEVARLLQESMLTGDLPQAAGVEIAASYRRRSAACRWVGTGMTHSGWPRGPSRWSSATWSAVGSRRPRRWDSCGARPGHSPRPDFARPLCSRRSTPSPTATASG